MYNLLQTQIIENSLTPEQIQTLVTQHGYYVTYEEDKRPANVFNTFTVRNMPPAPDYEPQLIELLKTNYLTQIDATLPDNLVYAGCMVYRLNPNSKQPPTTTTLGLFDLSLEICLRHDDARPMYIVDDPNNQNPGDAVKYDTLLGQGLLWVSSRHLHFRPQIPQTPTDNPDLRNIYVKYVWGMDVPTNTDLQT
jgi:hypothetical protein